MPRRKRPVLGVDFIIDDRGKAEFTREFLLGRGYCCDLACRFCPFPQNAACGAPSPDVPQDHHVRANAANTVSVQ